jgi:hypothetical protein
LAHFPAKTAPSAIPQSGAAIPRIDALEPIERRRADATVAATTMPAMTAICWMAGRAPRWVMPPERTRTKRKPIREAYADRRVRERCQTKIKKATTLVVA